MRITRVRFEAFKSLYDVSCDLDNFTVITGPNGAGKSNLVDALNFLGEAYSHGLEIAVSRHGGYENIAHRRTRRARKPVAITIELLMTSADFKRMARSSPWLSIPHELTKGNHGLTYRHSFSLGTDSRAINADFRVLTDRVEVFDSNSQLLLYLTRNAGEKLTVWSHEDEGSRPRDRERTELVGLLYPFTDVGFIEFAVDKPSFGTSLLTEFFSYGGLLEEVRRAVSGVRVFQLSPHQCRSSGVPTPNAALERHGENLPGAADHLMRNEPKAWNQVEAAMRAVIPQLESIEIAHTEDRRLALQFREAGAGRPWSSNEVSDGTMQSLAIFVALFEPRTPIAIVEEPENSIHPWVLRRIVDLASSPKSVKQVIVTTHSPVLLDYVRPEVIRLMTIKEGRSSLGKFLDFDPDLREGLVDGTLSVFQAYDSGVIPEAVPRGLSVEG